MKIVTYNVNGIRQRISQYGSLLKLLDSFDADIICFQETKLRRQEITADFAMADGYESFFSCTRTSEKGRMGYSGVATFCRVKTAFSSHEVALPVAAEEGFTGLLENSRTCKDDMSRVAAQGLEEFPRDELLKIDNEGRCVITDHGHFVLFNLYGPRATADDPERIDFKLKFYKMLEKRWESLLHQGRRIFVVGDLNIAPTAIDRCEAGPDFEKNEFRKWFRSILLENGGSFIDVFREKYPGRKEAYTCWPSNSGAEQFNYGTRIDHILFAGSCLHQEHNQPGHNFSTCHLEDCDIMTQYKRFKPGNTARWKGGLSVKLEGSDHIPVFTTLVDIHDVQQHSTPTLASRYLPMIHGFQQTLVSLLMKRQAVEEIRSSEVSSSSLNESTVIRSCSETIKRSSNDCIGSSLAHDESCSSLDRQSESGLGNFDKQSKASPIKSSFESAVPMGKRNINLYPSPQTKKKARKNQGSQQLSLRSFFQKSTNDSNDVSIDQLDNSMANDITNETSLVDDSSCIPIQTELNSGLSTQNQDERNSSITTLENEKNNVALVEWQRIQQLMQNSIPVCKGHKEPCVARIVKKQGPTFGRRFYVCPRAEGPASNPEANCGFFKWASSKFREN